MKIHDLKDIERLFIFKADRLIGTLERTTNAAVFRYAPEYLSSHASKPLCFTIPLTKESVPCAGSNVHPYFAGLLPEGLRLTALLSTLKTSSDDLFSLLAASGSDCIGDVFAYHEASIPQDPIGMVPPSLASVSFQELFEESIGAADMNWRLLDPAIPGVQPKLSAQMISFPLRSVPGGARSLLKLAPKRLPRLVENEHLCMRLALECGLRTANCQIVHDKNALAGLLVERFDRRPVGPQRALVKLHQEDACQFLDRYPQDKYRLSLREIAEGLNRFSSAPVVEIARLLSLHAFSYLIGNGDLHAKNISLLEEPDSGRIVLSPAYDLVSTLPYGDQTMALHLEGRRDRLRMSDFLTCGQRFGVRAAAIRANIEQLCRSLLAKLDRFEEIGFDKKKTKLLKLTAKQRAEQLGE